MSKKTRAAANLDYCAGIIGRNADALLCSRWLLDAVTAQLFLVELKTSGNERAKKALKRLESSSDIDFGISAVHLLGQVLRVDIFNVSMSSEEAEFMALFVHMGFLQREGHFYAIALPELVTAKTVLDALLALAATEDAGCMIHPHRVLMASAA